MGGDPVEAVGKAVAGVGPVDQVDGGNAGTQEGSVVVDDRRAGLVREEALGADRFGSDQETVPELFGRARLARQAQAAVANVVEPEPRLRLSRTWGAVGRRPGRKGARPNCRD